MFNRITLESILNILDKTSPIATALISSILAYFVAWGKARHEIRKFTISSKREDTLSARKAFTVLNSSLEDYCRTPCVSYHKFALDALSDFLSVAPYSLKPLLINLYKALSTNDSAEVKTLKQELFVTYSQHIDDAENNPKRK